MTYLLKEFSFDYNFLSEIPVSRFRHVDYVNPAVQSVVDNVAGIVGDVYDASILFRHVDYVNPVVQSVVDNVAGIVGDVYDASIRFVPNCYGIGHYNPDTKTVYLDYETFVENLKHEDDVEQAERLKFILLHELRHRDQINRGYLKIEKSGKAHWFGEFIGNIYSYGESHFKLPWEIDANAYALRHSKKNLLNNFKIWVDIYTAMRNNSIELVTAY